MARKRSRAKAIDVMPMEIAYERPDSETFFGPTGGPKGHIDRRVFEAGPTAREFWDVLGCLARDDLTLIDVAERGMSTEPLAHVPTWLNLAPEEVEAAAKYLTRMMHDYPVRTWWELLLSLAVEATRKKKRGRKGRWLGSDGLSLVMRVDDELRARGLSRGKGLDLAIEAVKAANPSQYSKFSNATLRAGYYAARPLLAEVYPCLSDADERKAIDAFIDQFDLDDPDDVALAEEICAGLSGNSAE